MASRGNSIMELCGSVPHWCRRLHRLSEVADKQIAERLIGER
jgi:hypothetical protein